MPLFFASLIRLPWQEWFDVSRYYNSESLPIITEHAVEAVAVTVAVFIGYAIASRGLRLAQLSGRMPRSVVWMLRKVLRWIATLLGVVLILQVLGVFESVFTAVAGALTLVAVGFVAFWSVLSNLFCALILMASRPFRLGDRLTFTGDNLTGTVIDFNLLFTTLQVEQNRVLQVPNNMFFQRMFLREIGADTMELGESLNQPPRQPLQEQPQART